MKDKIKKITGISTPFGGISWTPPADEKRIARNTITYFEDKRILYVNLGIEAPLFSIQSIIQIRNFLTEQMMLLNHNSKLYTVLESFRFLFRTFQTEIENLEYVDRTRNFEFKRDNYYHFDHYEDFENRLRIMRQKAYEGIKHICETYEIQPHGELKAELDKESDSVT